MFDRNDCQARQSHRRTDPVRSHNRRIQVNRAAACVALLLAHCAATTAPEQEASRIATLLGMRPGMTVADVGAGDGEWSEDLARRVGVDGHVFSTEIDEDDLEDIRQRLDDAGLSNVTTVLGSDHDTGLPEDCCDAVLLRRVYHHFTEPEKMRASLRQALRADGILVVIDLEPQHGWSELPGVPDRGGHGIPIADLIAEMTRDGFEVVTRIDTWENDEEDGYCVVFRTASSEPLKGRSQAGDPAQANREDLPSLDR